MKVTLVCSCTHTPSSFKMEIYLPFYVFLLSFNAGTNIYEKVSPYHLVRHIVGGHMGIHHVQGYITIYSFWIETYISTSENIVLLIS